MACVLGHGGPGAESLVVGAAQRRTRYRPSFERLEDRAVPTTVTTQAQLITAINSANTAGGAHDQPGRNITLFERTPNNTHDGPNGLPEITNRDHLTINGNGHTIRRLTGPFGVGDAAFRLFAVGSGGTLNLNDMTLENGLVTGTSGTTTPGGGAIFVDSGGTLNLNQDALTRNAVSYNATPSFSSDIDVQGGADLQHGECQYRIQLHYRQLRLIPSGGCLGHGDDNVGDGLNNSDSVNGDDNGLDGNVVVAGGGSTTPAACSSKTARFRTTSPPAPSSTSSLTPANDIGNGNSIGDHDSGRSDANSNCNGLLGNITVEGGGLYNASSAMLTSGSVSGNSAKSTVTNGSHNGGLQRRQRHRFRQRRPQRQRRRRQHHRGRAASSTRKR